MNHEFKQCLESKKITTFARGKKLVEKRNDAWYEYDDISPEIEKKPLFTTRWRLI